MVPFIQVNEQITIFSNTPITIGPDHPNYEQIKDILENEREDDITTLLHPTTQIVKKTLALPGFHITDGALYYNNSKLSGYIVDRILELVDANKPVTRMLKFLENLLQNPSNRVYEHLFEFLEKGQLPITEDGYFLAYKKVNGNYTDCHTGTINNSIDTTVSMPRQSVDDNPNNTCSHGLHVCSFDYLAHFCGERIIVVCVNPRDVVSIPVDHNHTKMRVCRYDVIDEIPWNTAQNIWKEQFVNLKPSENKNESEDEDEQERRYCITMEYDGEDEETIYYYIFAPDKGTAENIATERHPNYTVTDCSIDDE